MNKSPGISRQKLLLFGLLLMAVVTRFVRLDAVPQPINHDVASNGYDAWSLLETGADRWGNSWPIHLEAFGQGDYRPAMYTYLTIPFVAIVGPEHITAAARGTAATIGVLSVYFLYCLIRRLYDWKMASWAALLMVLSPWALQMSRFGHESSLTVIVPIVLLLSLSRAGWPMRRQDEGNEVRLSILWMAVFGLLVSLSLYTYASMRLFLPLFLSACVLIYAREWKRILGVKQNQLALLICGVLLLVVSTPLVYQMVTHWDRINARAEEVSMFHQGTDLLTTLGKIVVQYAKHYMPEFLFIRGDRMAWNNVPGVGVCNWGMLILLPVGLYSILRNRKDRVNLVILAWFILFPIAAATTTRAPHALRSACGVGAMVWVGMIGLNAILQYAARKEWTKGGRVLALIAIAAGGAYVFRCYFVDYARSTGYAAVQQSDYVEAMRFLQDDWKKYDRIFITDHADFSQMWFNTQPYILALMYLPVEPETFQQWEKEITYDPPPLDHFHVMQRMGPIVMSTRPEVLASFFGTFDPPPAESALIIARPGDFGGMPLMQTIRDRRGNVRLEIYEYQPSNYK